jgi:hypothetical protein
MNGKMADEAGWELEQNLPHIKKRNSKYQKNPKEELGDWDEEDIPQRAKQKGRMKDIEERLERKLLYKNIEWTFDD